MKVELGKFLEVMGIPYKDIHLFKEAFTHPSYQNLFMKNILINQKEN